jgi:hypothetical protein
MCWANAFASNFGTTVAIPLEAEAAPKHKSSRRACGSGLFGRRRSSAFSRIINLDHIELPAHAVVGSDPR